MQYRWLDVLEVGKPHRNGEFCDGNAQKKGLEPEFQQSFGWTRTHLKLRVHLTNKQFHNQLGRYIFGLTDVFDWRVASPTGEVTGGAEVINLKFPPVFYSR